MDSQSQHAMSALFESFPDWRSLARTERAEDGTDFLVLEIAPPPGADVQHCLTVDTAGGEVTVSFDYYHAHFNESIGDGERFGTTAAVEFIRQIVNEKVAIVSWWKGDEWRASAESSAGSHPEMNWASDFDRIRIRSWRGTLNADIEV